MGEPFGKSHLDQSRANRSKADPKCERRDALCEAEVKRECRLRD